MDNGNVTLVDKAKRLEDTLNNKSAIIVGIGNDKIHVYSTKRFCGIIPATWENVEVIHHKNIGKIKSIQTK